ncbi:MAG: hypothetical protein PHR73_06550, partial [Candidatus Omnitrophica bacterium]|nr:hypothetical protein [Candidatus Omnitrophota bacterium]
LAKTIKKLSDPATLKVLRNLGVKYAIVNGNAYTESGLLEDSEELSRIKSSAGLGPVFSADGIDIFKIKSDKGAS